MAFSLSLNRPIRFPTYEIDDDSSKLEDYLFGTFPSLVNHLNLNMNIIFEEAKLENNIRLDEEDPSEAKEDDPNDEILGGGPFGTFPSLVNHLNLNMDIIFEEAKPENNIRLDEEDPSEAEEDDPKELIFGNDFVYDSEIPFTANDLEAFCNEPEEENMMTNVSKNSFHSTHQSLLSSPSMVNHLGGLAMNLRQLSKSSSSKRKTSEGDEDTATSNLMGAKKNLS